jgi:hypothetical protein
MGLRLDREYLAKWLEYPLTMTSKEPFKGFSTLRKIEREVSDWIDFKPSVQTDLVNFVATGADPVNAKALSKALTELRDLFIEAAEMASAGSLHPEIAQALARVRRLDNLRTVDAQDCIAFGAWCLQRLLSSRRPLTVACCNLCQELWLPDRKNAGEYCSRPAPGQRQTCAEVMAQQAYATEHGDYARERRRLGQQARRGAITAADFNAWKADNRPGRKGRDWRTYDQWRRRTNG